MTEKLYYQSAYLRSFDANVLSCEPDQKSWLIELDRTAFYPEGGGQPADNGMLREHGNTSADAAAAGRCIRVLDVQEKGGRILHRVSGPLTPGTRVHGEIDWERRFDHMQQHSGEHVVSGMLCSHFDCDNIGFHLGKDTVTIDYNTEISWEALQEIEEEANRYIWEDHEIQILCFQDRVPEELEYRSKKELEGEIRITVFPGADSCACCGTHVARSGEVGIVKFLSAQHIGKGTRIELLCGNRAYTYLRMNFDSNTAVARAMAASPDKTEAVYLKQKDELIQAKLRLSELEKKYFQQLAEQYRGQGDVLHFEEHLNPDSIRRLAVSIGAVCGGRAAVFSGEGSIYRYAMTGEEEALKFFVKQMNQALDGRGGGGKGFAQGSVNVSAAQIRKFYEGKL